MSSERASGTGGGPDAREPRSEDPSAARAGAAGPLPDGFLFGAATSAYQIEGSPLADGAGPSIWHRFAHLPDRIRNGDDGDVACDHYRRYAEDVELMRDLGLDAYRFSLSWSRVLPEGRGRVNAAGLDFYSRLVDHLLAAGITPCVTLYHWDLPAALEDLGGWLAPDVVSWFAEYARVVFRALGDRVPLWTTVNEPWVVVDGGYLHGVHAPGRRSAAEAVLAAHHLLRAHAAAVRVHRVDGRGRIGLVVNLEPKEPASDAPEDAAAAQRADAYMNRTFLDAVFFGRYPEELAAIFGTDWIDFPPTELDEIREPFDFLGINYYTRGVVRPDPSGLPPHARNIRLPGAVYTETGWEVHPESLTRTLLWVTKRYGDIPLYITENGAAFDDPPPGPDGVVSDMHRVAYLRDHLRAALDARRLGVDLRGYFVWSLLDNLEWAEGFTKRFGIVHVDRATQRRTPKASAHFYRDTIATRGAALER